MLPPKFLSDQKFRPISFLLGVQLRVWEQDHPLLRKLASHVGVWYGTNQPEQVEIGSLHWA